MPMLFFIGINKWFREEDIDHKPYSSPLMLCFNLPETTKPVQGRLKSNIPHN
jgi:hypothetical protein